MSKFPEDVNDIIQHQEYKNEIFSYSPTMEYFNPKIDLKKSRYKSLNPWSRIASQQYALHFFDEDENDFFFRLVFHGLF
jgi:hypothetical protein